MSKSTSTPAEKPQHLQALDQANETRLRRSALKAWVKEPGDQIVSRNRLADLITAYTGPVEPALRSLMLEDFLMWGYRMYPSRRNACYALAECTPHRKLGDLTDRQRRLVANTLLMPAAQLDEAVKLHDWQRRHGTAA